MKDVTDSIDNAGAETWQIPHLPLITRPHFTLHAHRTLDNQPDSERAALEEYIYQRFLQVHDAHVTHFLPLIVGLRCHAAYSAAVGLAPAVQGTHPQPLFAERYLTQPIEAVIASRLGCTIERHRIVEIGNLVSSWKGSSLLLFIFLSEVIERLGYHWVLFTATREVEALLTRLRYAPVVLTDADPGKLHDAGESWGRYYQRQPRVMFGDVRSAVSKARTNSLYRAAVSMMESQINKVCLQYQALLLLNNEQVSVGSQQDAGAAHE